MPQLVVDFVTAVPLRRPKGIQVTLVNQSAVDVYMDREVNRVNQSTPTGVPSGTKIAASGGQVQLEPFPGEMWFRTATTVTTIEVQP